MAVVEGGCGQIGSKALGIHASEKPDFHLERVAMMGEEVYSSDDHTTVGQTGKRLCLFIMDMPSMRMSSHNSSFAGCGAANPPL